MPVQLNRHKFKTVHVTAREASKTALNVLETLVSSAVKQLAQDVLQDIFGEVTQANYGDPASAYFTNLFGDEIMAKSFMTPIAQPRRSEGALLQVF